MRNWRKPQQDEPLPGRFPGVTHDDLLAHHRTAFERRKHSYPKLVERGDMTARDADNELLAWSNLIEQWLWISTDGEAGRPIWQPSELGHARRTVQAANARIEQELERSPTRELRQLHLLNEATDHVLSEIATPDPSALNINQIIAFNLRLREERKTTHENA